MTAVGKLSHNPNVTIRQYKNGERTIEVVIRGEHVYSATRRFGVWTVGEVVAPDQMTFSEMKQFAQALLDAHEYITTLSK